MVSSEAHRQAPKEGIQFDNLSGEKGYTSWLAYGQSKLANILFAKELARRLEGTDKVANALHPGVINTNLARHMNSIVDVAMSAISPIALKSIPQGAATQTYLAAHPDAAKVSGEYFSHCNPARPTSKARDAALATKLWEKSEEIVAEFK
jgi:WW domain-containing oxidoreductase